MNGAAGLRARPAVKQSIGPEARTPARSVGEAAGPAPRRRFGLVCGPSVPGLIYAGPGGPPAAAPLYPGPASFILESVQAFGPRSDRRPQPGPQPQRGGPRHGTSPATSG